MTTMGEKRAIVKIAEEVFEAKLEEFQEAFHVRRAAAIAAFKVTKEKELAPLVKKATKLAEELSTVRVQIREQGGVYLPGRYGKENTEAIGFFERADADDSPIANEMNTEWRAHVSKGREALRAFKLATWTDGEEAMREFVGKLEEIFGR